MKRKFVVVEQYQHQYHMRVSVSTYVILINYLTVIIYLFIFNSYKHVFFFWLNENLTVKVICLPLNVSKK